MILKTQMIQSHGIIMERQIMINTSIMGSLKKLGNIMLVML